MLTFAGALRAVDEFLHSDSPPARATPSPIRFDHTLVGRLLGLHESLNAHFAHAVCAIDGDRAAALRASRECIEQFAELRRIESVWLYSVIGRGLADDPPARRQLVQLRMVMVTLGRRVMRELEQLTQALAAGEQPRSAADHASAPLAEYLRRSAFEIYPLYAVVGSRQPAAAPA